MKVLHCKKWYSHRFSSSRPYWKQSSCRSENRMTVPIFAERSFYYGLLGVC